MTQQGFKEYLHLSIIIVLHYNMYLNIKQNISSHITKIHYRDKSALHYKLSEFYPFGYIKIYGYINQLHIFLSLG